MRIEEFDYNLPDGLIAQHPVYPRDHAKLMVLHRNSKKIEHLKFFEIKKFFRKGDVLVLNNTKVIKARIKGVNSETGGKREIFLLKQTGEYEWKALTRPNKRIHPGDKIVINGVSGIYAEVIEKNPGGENIVKFFSENNLTMREILEAIGNVPLPPYKKEKLRMRTSIKRCLPKKKAQLHLPRQGSTLRRNFCLR